MAIHIRRREFIFALGGAAAAWPLAVRAQQSPKRPIIGILGPGNPASHGQFVSTFVQRLRQLGWLDGNNATIAYRWTENRNEHAAEIAAEFREYVHSGGLMSYGPNFPDLFRRAADFVDKILRGTKPGEIPVEQPTKFDLVINLTTAKALGLDVPTTLLARADAVIE